MNGLTKILRKNFIANISHHYSKRNYVTIVKQTAKAVDFGKSVVKMSSWGYLSHNGKSFQRLEIRTMPKLLDIFHFDKLLVRIRITHHFQ